MVSCILHIHTFIFTHKFMITRRACAHWPATFCQKIFLCVLVAVVLFIFAVVFYSPYYYCLICQHKHCSVVFTCPETDYRLILVRFVRLISSQAFHKKTCFSEPPLWNNAHMYANRIYFVCHYKPKLKTNKAGQVGLDWRFKNITIAPYQTIVKHTSCICRYINCICIYAND